MSAAIIDLGTNTFNLLIVNYNPDKTFKVLLNTKSAVMLGQEGINNGYISDKAFSRAYAVLRDFSEIITQFKCQKIKAFGTSAIRSASNSQEFITKIAEDLNIHIQPISGDQEAEYIYLGVKEAVTFESENFLILDIGGGSNEFIIANKDKMLWKQSFPIGGARLLEKFQPSDPITENEIIAINSYLNTTLMPLFEATQKYPVTKLVGSSGAFDTFAEILHHENYGFPLDKTKTSNRITIDGFQRLYWTIITSNKEQRLQIPGLEAIRVDTVVMATVFTKFVIDKIKMFEIIQSAYSLKEGVASQLQTN